MIQFDFGACVFLQIESWFVWGFCYFVPNCAAPSYVTTICLSSRISLTAEGWRVDGGVCLFAPACVSSRLLKRVLGAHFMIRWSELLVGGTLWVGGGCVGVRITTLVAYCWCFWCAAATSCCCWFSYCFFVVISLSARSCIVRARVRVRLPCGTNYFRSAVARRPYPHERIHSQFA